MRSRIVAAGVAIALLIAAVVFIIARSRRDGAAPPAHVASPARPAPPVAAPPPAEAAALAAPAGGAAQRRTAERRPHAAPPSPAERAAAQTAPPAPAPEAEPEPDRPLSPEVSGAIQGVLVDERGLPLGDTSVLAVATDGADGRETLSGDDGDFLLPGLRPGRYVVIPGFGSALMSRFGIRGVSVSAGRVSRLDLRERQRGGRLRVAAVDPDGRAAPGQAVLIAGAPGAAGSFGPLLGQELVWLPELGGGRMQFERVPPGTYTLVVLPAGERTIPRAAAEPVVVTDGDLHVNVRVGREVPPG